MVTVAVSSSAVLKKCGEAEAVDKNNAAVVSLIRSSAIKRTSWGKPGS